jgi:hypothetical protein
MAIDVTMPALSPTMEVGTLAKWHVKLGQTVKSGDIIAEIETDKATMEVEAVDEGTVIELAVPAAAPAAASCAPMWKRLPASPSLPTPLRPSRLLPLRWRHLFRRHLSPAIFRTRSKSSAMSAR